MDEPNFADDSDEPDEPTVAQKRYARRHIVAYIVSCIVIGLLTAAFFTQSWLIFWAALAFGTSYAMLLMLFMILAVVAGKPDEEEEAETNPDFNPEIDAEVSVVPPMTAEQAAARQTSSSL